MIKVWGSSLKMQEFVGQKRHFGMFNSFDTVCEINFNIPTVNVAGVYSKMAYAKNHPSETSGISNETKSFDG